MNTEQAAQLLRDMDESPIADLIEQQAAELTTMEARAVAAEKVIADALKHWRDTYACTDRVVIMSSILKSVDLTAAREMMRKAEEADTLRRQLQEAEALVERMRDALNAAATSQAAEEEENISFECQMACRIEAEAKRIKALTLGPAAALAEYRVSVLEEVAKLADAKAAECRRNSECADQEGHPIAGTNYRVRAVSMESLAAEIRAMGEKS